MFKFVLILTFLVSSSVFAQSKVPQTMDQINAILKAKKQSLEPFNAKDVKIDLESLGLDDLSKDLNKSKIVPPEEKLAKPEESKVVEEAKSQDLKESPQKKEEPKIEEKKQVEATAKTEEKKIETLPEKKTEELKKIDQKPLVQKTKIKKKNISKTSSYINSAKKRDLKKRLEAEKKQYVYEKKREEQALKLKELRKKYLAEFEEKDSDLANNEEVFDEDGETILPQKKNLNRFVSEEPPALPILDHFRTADNLHIPIILSYEERRKILFDAIKIGNINYFNNAYKDIENPDVTNQSGDTVLTYAILMKKYPVMAAILARGADPNLPNGLGYSPIDIAIELLDIKALEILVRNKADINYIDSFGRTSLMHAARLGFLPAVELFVLEGADVNAMDNDGFTALSIAYRHKKEVIVKFLLKNGAKPWIEKPYEAEKHSLIKELENRWK